MRHHEDDFDDEDGRYVVIERQDGGSSIGPFILGAAIGAGLALLFAPRSGAETRADIRRRARKARDAAQRVASGVTETRHRYLPGCAAPGRGANRHRTQRDRNEEGADAPRDGSRPGRRR